MSNEPMERILTPHEKCELSGRLFCGVDLDHVDFSYADLRGARFEGSDLSGCDFSGADMRGAQFVRCDLSRARLTSARLGDNRFDDSVATGASLSPIDREYLAEHGAVFAA